MITDKIKILALFDAALKNHYFTNSKLEKSARRFKIMLHTFRDEILLRNNEEKSYVFIEICKFFLHELEQNLLQHKFVYTCDWILQSKIQNVFCEIFEVSTPQIKDSSERELQCAIELKKEIKKYLPEELEMTFYSPSHFFCIKPCSSHCKKYGDSKKHDELNQVLMEENHVY